MIKIIAGRILVIILIVAGALLLSGLFSMAGAEAPMVKSQVPGYYRMMVGQFEITALADGFVDLDVKLMRNISDEKIRGLLDRGFTGYPKMKTSVNAYLINTGRQLVLVDAGAGKLLSAAHGNVMRNLKAAGYDPSQVDIILITHMHRDHVGGLVDADGRMAFPNATVYVARAESEFWLSEAEAAKAPVEARSSFKAVSGTAAPYIAAGRWKTFEGSGLPVAGISALAIPGHTAGHTAYEVKSGNEVFLVIGDMLHSAAIQFAYPDAAISFDRDTGQAISVRKVLFRKAAAEKTLLGGMHIPFPGIGHIRAEGPESYTWVPVEFGPMQ